MNKCFFGPNDKNITEEEKIEIVSSYVEDQYPLDEEEQILEAQF